MLSTSQTIYIRIYTQAKPVAGDYTSETQQILD